MRNRFEVWVPNVTGNNSSNQGIGGARVKAKTPTKL